MTMPGTGSVEGSVEGQAESGSGAEASGHHYPTHEAAEQAAREWQGKHDRLQAEGGTDGYAEALKQLGSPEQIRAFIDEMAVVRQRPDYQAYVSGQLGSGGGTESDYTSDEDPYKTDAEKEQDVEIAALRRERLGTAQERVEFRFERAESQLNEEFGEVWTPYRAGILNRIQHMARAGQLADPGVITPSLLRGMVLSEIGSKDGFKDVLTKMAGRWEDLRIGEHETATTTVPGGGRLGASAAEAAPAKSFAAAWAKGQADIAARGTG